MQNHSITQAALCRLGRLLPRRLEYGPHTHIAFDGKSICAARREFFTRIEVLPMREYAGSNSAGRGVRILARYGFPNLVPEKGTYKTIVTVTISPKHRTNEKLQPSKAIFDFPKKKGSEPCTIVVISRLQIIPYSTIKSTVNSLPFVISVLRSPIRSCVPL